MSASNIPDIPRPRSGDPETQRFYDAVRQAFSAVQRTDSQSLVTYEELGRRLLPLYDQYKNISDKVGGGNKCDGASVPGAVSNIQTSGAFGVITLKWDIPVYRGHGSTEVWASKGTDVAAAELVGTSETTYLEHAVPAIEFTTENEYEVSRNYWLRHVSACDKGYGPWSDMVTGKTPASPTLIGEIMARNAGVMIHNLGLDQDLAEIDVRIIAARDYAQALVNSAETALWGTVTQHGSDIKTIQTINDTQATLITGLRTDTDTSSSRITNVENTNADQATQISSLSTRTDEAESGITVLNTTTANQATQLNSLSTSVGQHTNSINTLNQTTANQSAQINDIRTTANGAYAAVQTKAETSVVEGLDGRLDTVQAKYTVQTDVDGYIQGYGLLNTGSPTTSGIAFNVNNFYVTNTVNGTKHHPFMIEGNKVYADNLFVRQANIEKLNVMDVATSGVIKSANYSANAGWMIDNAGNAVFNTITIRGNSSSSSQSYYSNALGYYRLTGIDGSGLYWGSKGAKASFTLPVPTVDQRMLILVTGRTGIRASDAGSYSRAIQLSDAGGILVADTGLSSATGDFFQIATTIQVSAGVTNSFFIVATTGKGASPSIAGKNVETITDTLTEFGLVFTVNVLGVKP